MSKSHRKASISDHNNEFVSYTMWREVLAHHTQWSLMASPTYPDRTFVHALIGKTHRLNFYVANPDGYYIFDDLFSTQSLPIELPASVNQKELDQCILQVLPLIEKDCAASPHLINTENLTDMRRWIEHPQRARWVSPPLELPTHPHAVTLYDRAYVRTVMACYEYLIAALPGATRLMTLGVATWLPVRNPHREIYETLNAAMQRAQDQQFLISSCILDQVNQQVALLGSE